MNNYLFLLPLYNDWESLLILHEKINDQMGKLKKRGKILIINDFSNNEPPIFKKYENIDEVQIINLNKNLGSQKAISVGLKYLKSSTNNTIITILDSDGEDDVNKIPDMINEAENNPKKIIVSTRTKRQENSFFRAAYFFHKFLIRGMFKAGTYGFAISISSAMGRWLKDIKQYELIIKNKKIK